MSYRATVIAASGFLAVSLFGVSARQPPAATKAQPTFRAGINYVELPVRVTDRQGNFVQDLRQSDFNVSEDGWKQDTRRTKSPMALSTARE